jgi:hypothetical protein
VGAQTAEVPEAPGVFKPGLPLRKTTDDSSYRDTLDLPLGVGTFRDERNARAAYNHLVNIGFSPNYEWYGNYLRVVISGIREGEREHIARRLEAAGFVEVWFREER